MRAGTLRVSVVSLLLLAACSGDDAAAKKDRPPLDDTAAEDTDDDDRPEVTLTLVSPREDAEYATGDTVTLEVTAKRGSRDQDIESATWTIGDWTGEGASTEATGLPAGEHEVEVEVEVDGDTFRESVDITVLAPAQTVFTYAGTLDADVMADIDGLGDFEDHCSSPITFTLDAGTISGSGTCAVFDEYDFDPMPFTMTGSVRGGAISGALIMNFDGSEARTPYEGPGTAGDPLTASFDTTHRSSDGSVRIVGSWSATAQ